MTSTSPAPEPINSLLAGYEAKLTQVGTKSVLIQVALMAALSLLSIILFAVLRPANRNVYAPKWKYYTSPERRAPNITNGLLAWLTPVRTIKEDEMLDKIGFDGVTFLRFLRMSRWMFTAVALLACCVLIPVNVSYNLNHVDSGRRNNLSMISISGVKGNLLYIHVGVSYLIAVIVCAFIYFNTARMMVNRIRYFQSPEYQQALFSRSIMITGIHKANQSDLGLQQLLQNLRVPYPTTAVHIGRRVGELPELIDFHSETVRKLEQVLTTYLRNPNKLPAKRPTIRVGAVFGCCGGRQHDAIVFLTAKIERLEAHIEQLRETIDDRKAQPYGFASFLKVPYAHLVAKTMEGKRPSGTTIELAPRPTDVIWKNMVKSDSQRFRLRLWGGFILFIVMILYTIPLVAVAFLANLTAVTQFVPFLDAWSNNSEFTFSAVAGITPPLLSVLLQLILPVIMRKLGKYQGVRTRTQLDRGVLARYFSFLILTQLIIFSLLGVVFNLITEIIVEVGKKEGAEAVLKSFSKLPGRIQVTYIQQSSYWLSWYPLRGFTAAFEIAQLLNLTWIWFRTHVFGRTVRDIRDWTKPPNFDYPVNTANFLLMVAVGLIYAPLAPLVAMFCAVAFFMSATVYKYQLLFVYTTKVESGGRMWRMITNRILVSLVFMHLLMILTIGLNSSWLNSISAAPPILCIIVFKIVLNSKFGAKRWNYYIPTDAEIAAAHAHHSDERKHRLARRFGHPSLHAPLITPLIHASAQHMLSTVYSGRIASTDTDATNAHGIKAGGINFGAVEKDDIELSRDDYLREQDAWETGSMASTALLDDGTRPGLGSRGPSAMATDAQARTEAFAMQHHQYLSHGPARSQSMDTMELGPLPIRRESQENLLNTPQWAPSQSYRDPYARSESYANSSQASMFHDEPIGSDLHPIYGQPVQPQYHPPPMFTSDRTYANPTLPRQQPPWHARTDSIPGPHPSAPSGYQRQFSNGDRYGSYQ